MGKAQAQVAPAPRRKGALGFEAHYQAIFEQRWPLLRQALLAPSMRVVRINPFASEQVRQDELLHRQALAFASDCFEIVAGNSAEQDTFQPTRDDQGLLAGYILDPASVLAARLVAAPAHGRVLDLCAAPGGKSLILAERYAPAGELVLNDRSGLRRKRLLQVLKDYLPEGIRSRIRVHQRDGRLWGKRDPDAYDAILLDAPCSSEAHVLKDQSALEQWSASRSQRLSRDQLALLRSSISALRPRGQLVYCTCSLTPQENDAVIGELLDRDPRAQSIPTMLPIGEATRHGWHILPDTTGYGPMFVAQLIKT